jgi:hypothetical protein
LQQKGDIAADGELTAEGKSAAAMRAAPWGMPPPSREHATKVEAAAAAAAAAHRAGSPISYKHVNFCGVHRPYEQSYNKEDYCVHHANEETNTWLRDLDELGEKVCELYPFLCEFCGKTGHFNFQCPIN